MNKKLLKNLVRRLGIEPSRAGELSLISNN